MEGRGDRKWIIRKGKEEFKEDSKRKEIEGEIYTLLKRDEEWKEGGKSRMR